MLKLVAGTFAGAILVVAAVMMLGVVSGQAAECGMASWYGAESGSVTASGASFDGSGMTAAHRSLPFGTRLKVSWRGRAVVVTVNDRGPFVRGRMLDLSRAAARRLGIISAGVARVCIERIG